jgi:hypothetical protein
VEYAKALDDMNGRLTFTFLCLFKDTNITNFAVLQLWNLVNYNSLKTPFSDNANQQHYSNTEDTILQKFT